MLLGPEVVDWLDVPVGSVGVQLLLTLGVSLILFYGGLQLSLRILSRVGVGLGLLAVPGVVITAVVTGAAATVAFDIPFEEGFLIGAVIAPTDPAILIPLFERLRGAAEGRSDGHRGVGTERPHRRRARADDRCVHPRRRRVRASAAGDFFAELAISTVLGIMLGVLLALVVSERRSGSGASSPPSSSGSPSRQAMPPSTPRAGAAISAFIAGLIADNTGLLGLRVSSPPARRSTSLPS